jgi:aminopeptidase N
MKTDKLKSDNIKNFITENTINYPPSQYFVINHMWLLIEPDFKTKRLQCKQQLKITALQDLEKIELDCAYNNQHKIIIDSLLYSNAASIDDKKKIIYQQYNDKLILDFDKRILEGSKFYLIINYSVNGSKPGRGFYFVEHGDQLVTQAWTQGEAIESKNWFPCIDHPQIKFPRELSVIVPDNLIVISNGEKDLLDQEVKIEGKKKYVWEESHPNTAYVTSVVVGEFAELPIENYDNRIPLLFYVPLGQEEEGRLLFKNTIKMMRFFEKFLDTKYPYDKYSQVIVENFPYGGMENTTCTTLESALLPDAKTIQDNPIYDYVIVHELAHQWFGNLVTCHDWTHAWLNESFTSYCEALFYEDFLGKDEFYYYMLKKADDYLNNTLTDIVHKIPLVTKIYNDPLEMFNFARTYQKGAFIVHMIRYLIGNEDFRNSLKSYLDTFKYKTAETEDIRKIFEYNSGKNLQKFFDQWIYQAGHPILEVSLTLDDSIIHVDIEQSQISKFEFYLEILLVLQNENGEEKKIEENIFVVNKKTKKSFKIPPMFVIKRFVIDPYFKILKKINITNTNIDNDNKSLFLNSLLYGESIIEKIYAARELAKNPSNKLIDPLKKLILKDDIFWGVRVETIKIFTSLKTNESYDALKECLEINRNNKIRESIISALGSFRNQELFELLKDIVENNDESIYVRHAAAIAIAKCGKEDQTFSILSNLLEKKSYKNIIARGGAEGLKIIGIESDRKETIDDIESILIEKSKVGNESRLRQTATSSLGYIAKYHKERANIFNNLVNLLDDDSIHIRNTAYASLGNAFQYSKDSNILQKLRQTLKDEFNGHVRQTAEKSLRVIEETIPSTLTRQKKLLQDTNYKLKEIEDLERDIALY